MIPKILQTRRPQKTLGSPCSGIHCAIPLHCPLPPPPTRRRGARSGGPAPCALRPAGGGWGGVAPRSTALRGAAPRGVRVSRVAIAMGCRRGGRAAPRQRPCPPCQGVPYEALAL